MVKFYVGGDTGVNLNMRRLGEPGDYLEEMKGDLEKKEKFRREELEGERRRRHLVLPGGEGFY